MVDTKQEETETFINSGQQDNSLTVSTIHMYKGLDNVCIIINEVDNNLFKQYFADFCYSKNNGLSFNKANLLPQNNTILSDFNF